MVDLIGDVDLAWQNDVAFETWWRSLDEDVIQGEYGYERGEFDVFPEMWWPLYKEGLTPSQAFKRALDAHGEARNDEPPTAA